MSYNISMHCTLYLQLTECYAIFVALLVVVQPQPQRPQNYNPLLVASFPDLPCFDLPIAFTIIQNSEDQRKLKWSAVNEMSDFMHTGQMGNFISRPVLCHGPTGLVNNW